MKRVLKSAVLSAVLAAASGALLSGCTSTVYTKVNAFRAPDVQLTPGPVVIGASDASKAASLEFAHYRARTAEQLGANGFTVVSDGQPHDYSAQLSYSTEQAELDRGAARGVYGRGYPYFGFNYGLGFGRGYYGGYGSGLGVVVVDDGRELGYMHKLELVLLNTDTGERVFEARGYTESRCGVFSVVFDEMLTAILQDFPAADGSVKTIGVPGDSKC